MLKGIFANVQILPKVQKPFDPSHFGDSIAMQTKWTYARGGGTSFRTYNLVKIDNNRMEFRSSIKSRLLHFMFILVPLLIFLVGFLLSQIIPVKKELIIVQLVPLSLVVIGIIIYYFATAPIVFDKHKRSFWKGRTEPDQISDKKKLKYFAKLEDIHALQIISEHCIGENNSYYSYELNLVLKNATRINVVDHGDLEQIRLDSQVLSAFLDKKLWDAITLND